MANSNFKNEDLTWLKTTTKTDEGTKIKKNRKFIKMIMINLRKSKKNFIKVYFNSLNF